MGIRYYIFGICILALTISAVYFPFSVIPDISWESDYPADSHFKKGLKFLSRDSLLQAEHAFKEAITYQPRFAPPHYYLAETSVRQGKMQQALFEFSRTIEIDPEYYPAFYSLGTLLGNAKEYPDAIALLKRAVTLNPGYVEAYQKLAQLFVESGDFRSAEEIYGVLQKLKKSN